MSESSPSTNPVSITDPVAFATDAGVSIADYDRPHDEQATFEAHCGADAAGRVIVGVTNPDGAVLLLVSEERSTYVLPNETVGRGADWAAVARETVSALAGLECTIEGVTTVRRMHHVLSDTNEQLDTTVSLVLRAETDQTNVPAALCEDNPFSLGWFTTPPLEAAPDRPGRLHVDDAKRLLNH